MIYSRLEIFVLLSFTGFLRFSLSVEKDLTEQNVTLKVDERLRYRNTLFFVAEGSMFKTFEGGSKSIQDVLRGLLNVDLRFLIRNHSLVWMIEVYINLISHLYPTTRFPHIRIQISRIRQYKRNGIKAC
jgi:hypothetical protein